jgi:eukaryotic-like serine/threonine-protein kinase
MSIKAGTRIGPYEVTSPLGEGGMGVVFRAHDTKLQRDVALKLLPDHFADDPERLARFEREARVLASLNHPNIAQIHGLEESENTRCIVMELVEGATVQGTAEARANSDRRSLADSEAACRSAGSSSRAWDYPPGFEAR